MIKSLILKNFRNFEDLSVVFKNEKFFIIGENGKGKTNILEALSLLNNNSILSIDFDTLIKKGENNFFIEYCDDLGDTYSISYNKLENKKFYLINKKQINKKNFCLKTNTSVIFSPFIMNIMYLSPSLRRDFIDQILISTFNQYSKILINYKKIIKNRNKVLKNIKENKSKINEIDFWNQLLIKEAIIIYEYRFKLITFFEKHIDRSKEFFGGKIDEIRFIYKTKINKNTIGEDMLEYLEKNIDRDIILAKTNIGPHIDDFEILVDGINLIKFASRGETKSIIIWMKFLETSFIEKYTNKKPILLIDDLLSELDDNHKKLLINKIKYYQTIITSINYENKNNNYISI